MFLQIGNEGAFILLMISLAKCYNKNICSKQFVDNWGGREGRPAGVTEEINLLTKYSMNKVMDKSE